MTKHRILHLITRLPVGGAERLLADVVRMLDVEQFESIVCCIQDGGAIADEIAASGIPVVTLGLMAQGGFDRQVVPALVELIQRERVELVHSHLYHANLYGRLAARRAGIVAVASVHNAYTKRKWYRHLINRWLAHERHCAAVIAVSEDIRRDVLRYDRAPARKVVVLPNGIDPSRVATTLSPEAAKVHLGFDASVFLIGCVGRLEEQKGHTYLLSALATLRTDFPQLRLALAGDGRLRDTLMAQARALRVDDIVHFLGTRSDMATVLRAFDLYVMPSLWEGLSLAMLEAMSAGLPVIISDVGGAAEVLGDNEFGMRIPSADVGRLTFAIRQLIESPMQRQKLAEMARQRIADRYDVRRMTQHLGAIYIAALSGERLCAS